MRTQSSRSGPGKQLRSCKEGTLSSSQPGSEYVKHLARSDLAMQETRTEAVSGFAVPQDCVFPTLRVAMLELEQWRMCYALHQVITITNLIREPLLVASCMRVAGSRVYVCRHLSQKNQQQLSKNIARSAGFTDVDVGPASMPWQQTWR